MSRKKALKRKLGKKVLAGKITVGEARARLGREMAQKSARPSWSAPPPPQPVLRYPADEEYLRSAFLPIPVPQPVVTKSRKAAAAAGPSPQQMVMKARAAARASDICNQLPPLVVKQLGDVDRAVVAGLRRELALRGDDPAERERIKSRLAQMTGVPFVYGVV